MEVGEDSDEGGEVESDGGSEDGRVEVERGSGIVVDVDDDVVVDVVVDTVVDADEGGGGDGDGVTVATGGSVGNGVGQGWPSSTQVSPASTLSHVRQPITRSHIAPPPNDTQRKQSASA